MQRRSFLRNAACVGACASFLVPMSRAFANDARDQATSITMRMTRVSDAAPVADGDLRLQVMPKPIASDTPSLRVRAWFATDAGPKAFDLASFTSGQASQRLRFTADPQRLIGFEAASGSGFDDCDSLASCSVQGMTDLSLRPGRYQLALQRADQDIALIDLDVSAAAA
jgi:hypothetical protein